MRNRLMLGAAALLLVVISGLAIPFGITLGRQLTDQLGNRVEREANAVASAVEDILETSPNVDLQSESERYASQIGGRVLITDPLGVLLADSLQPPGSPAPSYVGRPEIASALRGEAVWDVRHSSTLDEDLLVSAVPVRTGDTILGVVRISYPMSEVNGSVRRTYWFLGAVGIVALATGLGLAAWLARWISKPLGHAAAIAREIAGGNLDRRVPQQGPPEIQELAVDLNLMTQQLQDLLRANREFAVDAAHQLRTPITALRLSLEEALAGTDPKQEVTFALQQAERLEKTVEALLALGREVTAVHSPVSLRAAADEALASLPGGDVSIQIEGGADALAGAEHVRQVVATVVENAQRFARSVISITIGSRDGKAWIRIEDDGPGIPEDEVERVFDRFFRGRQAGGTGTGLGLSVVRELVRADGGSISVGRSEMGGARFEISYTAARASESLANLNPTPRSVVM
jgi:signal transduction histidine kinase